MGNLVNDAVYRCFYHFQKIHIMANYIPVMVYGIRNDVAGYGQPRGITTYVDIVRSSIKSF
jgi:hypothetical protein